jgi:hypothetical protein
VKLGSAWSTYLLGPAYALLPRRWRALTYRGSQHLLSRAAFVSGIIEVVISTGVLSIWYLKFFGILGKKYIEYLVHAGQGSLFTWEAFSQAGFYTFLINPLTWIIVYFACEGILRALAALSTQEIFATLPLWAIERLYRLAKAWRPRPQLPLVPDEVTGGDGTCDIRIASCRKRPEWKYPFTIRYGGAYFQVIADKFISVGPRPYIYSLQRLPAGEIARGLQNYDPKDVLAPVEPLQPVG